MTARSADRRRFDPDDPHRQAAVNPSAHFGIIPQLGRGI